MNDEEFASFNFLKLKYRRREEITESLCRVGSPQEIRSTILNLRKFSKYDKNAAEACRNQSNPMNHKEFGSFNFLKLKYRSGDEINQLFTRIGSPQEIRSPLLNLRKF